METSMYCRSGDYWMAMTKRSRLVVLWVGLCSGVAAASEFTDAIQVHGFAGQAYIYTTDNDFFGESSDNGDFDFTELGLNVSASLNSRLQLAGQVLSRRAGEGDKGSLRIDYGLADYSLISGPVSRWGVRVGRILNPLGFYNETRDMAFTRPSIFLPQSIYFDRTRDLALSSDGVHTYGEYRTGGSEFFWQFGVAYPRVDNDELERALLGGLRPGDLESDVSYLGRILWEAGGGHIRVGLSAARVNIDYDPGKIDPFQAGSIRFEPLILSAQYNAEKWSLTTEYARRHFEFDNFHPLVDTTFTGESAYLQGVYRFARNWDALLRYDLLYTDRNDRNGNDFNSRTGLPAFSRFAKDWTFGLGWNINQAFLVRVEYHIVNGTAWLPAEDNPNPLSTEKRWEMFAFQASFRF